MAGNLSCCRFFNACKFATKKFILYLVCDMCVVTGVYWFALTNKNHIHFQAKMKCDYSYAILFAFYYWQWESLVMFYVVKIFCGVLLCLGTNASVIISSNVLTNLPACVRTKRTAAITGMRFISRVWDIRDKRILDREVSDVGLAMNCEFCKKNCTHIFVCKNVTFAVVVVVVVVVVACNPILVFSLGPKLNNFT